MKAPDKIYIQQDMINNLILEEREYADDVEYIRKDALMEWLEDMRFMANSERVGAYQNVIDKLNEM